MVRLTRQEPGTAPLQGRDGRTTAEPLPTPYPAVLLVAGKAVGRREDVPLRRHSVGVGRKPPVALHPRVVPEGSIPTVVVVRLLVAVDPRLLEGLRKVAA